MSRGPFSAAFGASRRQQFQRENTEQRGGQAEQELRKTKDAIAALCQRWRRNGSVSHAAELEQVMGWVPAGDPMTGCLPVTPIKAED